MDEEEIDITKLKYVLYSRKSTTDETRQVRSIPDQINECKELAKRLGLHIIGEPLTETKSAKKPHQRPVFRKIINEIKQGIYDAILAWNPDRLARNMLEGGEIIDLIDQNVIKDLKFVTHHFTKDANGKMLLGMAFVLSKQYSDDLSQKVTRGVRRSLEEGKTGTPKHGYSRTEGGQYQPDGKNHNIVCTAWQMRKKGYTIEDIVKNMNELGYVRITKNKEKRILMTKQTLSDVFRDPFYYGVLVQANQKVDLRQMYDFKPAVSEEDFFYIQSKYNRQDKPFKTKNRMFYPLKRLILCSFCNMPMYIGKSTGESGKQYLNARCDNELCHRKKRSVRMKVILIDFVYKFLEEGLNLTEKEYNDYYRGMKAITDNKRINLNQQIHVKEGMLKRKKEESEKISLKIINYDQNSPIYKANEKKVLELESEIDSLTDEITKLRNQLRDPTADKLTLEEFLNLSKNAATIVKSANPIAKDQICRKIFLNFKVDEEKVVSYQLKEPFATLLKTRSMSSGRGAGN